MSGGSKCLQKNKAVSKEGKNEEAEGFSWIVSESLSDKLYLNKDLKEMRKQTTQNSRRAKALREEYAWHYLETSRGSSG